MKDDNRHEVGSQIKVTEQRSDYYGYRGKVVSVLPNELYIEVKFSGLPNTVIMSVEMVATPPPCTFDKSQWWRMVA